MSSSKNLSNSRAQKSASNKKNSKPASSVKFDLKNRREKRQRVFNEMKKKISFKKMSHREEAIRYFEAIINGIKKGSIELKQESESLKLYPAENLKLDIKASSDGDKEKVSFKISWLKSDDNGESLEIS